MADAPSFSGVRRRWRQADDRPPPALGSNRTGDYSTGGWLQVQPEVVSPPRPAPPPIPPPQPPPPQAQVRGAQAPLRGSWADPALADLDMTPWRTSAFVRGSSRETSMSSSSTSAPAVWRDRRTARGRAGRAAAEHGSLRRHMGHVGFGNLSQHALPRSCSGPQKEVSFLLIP